jgi:hypothetical protein
VPLPTTELIVPAAMPASPSRKIWRALT